MTPSISVIIPVYNAEKYVSKAIDSVLNQTYTDFELIIVDDGSTDSSARIIERIEDSRIKFFSKSNEGQCKTLNYGLKKATGRFIKFLDADDYFNDIHLEQMMSIVQSLAPSEVNDTLIVSRWQRFSNENSLFPLYNRAEWTDSNPMEFILNALGNGPDMLPGWQWLIPRVLLDKAGHWNEELGLGNDFEFSIRLILASGRIKICREALVYYRSDLVHNMSADKSLLTIMSVLKASRSGIEYILQKDRSAAVKRVCADKLQIWLLSYYPYVNRSIVYEVEQEIRDLGGSVVNADWNAKLIFLKKVIGWKAVKMLQYYYYKLRY